MRLTEKQQSFVNFHFMAFHGLTTKPIIHSTANNASLLQLAIDSIYLAQLQLKQPIHEYPSGRLYPVDELKPDPSQRGQQ